MHNTISNLFANPYDRAVDSDEHALWLALIARDSEAFAAAEWSLCDGDFCHERFEGISAHGSFNPADWTLEYPTVQSYRDDWLRMAKKFNALPLAAISHRELLYTMQSFAKIEVAGDRALVWKQFFAEEPLTDGERYRLRGQSIYRLHRIDGAWRIVGFVGYLPMEPSAA
ncbi:MAG TPA: hypothetical protein VF175_07785 [Lacipirellula sp.]